MLTQEPSIAPLPKEVDLRANINSSSGLPLVRRRHKKPRNTPYSALPKKVLQNKLCTLEKELLEQKVVQQQASFFILQLLQAYDKSTQQLSRESLRISSLETCNKNMTSTIKELENKLSVAIQLYQVQKQLSLTTRVVSLDSSNIRRDQATTLNISWNCVLCNNPVSSSYETNFLTLDCKDRICSHCITKHMTCTITPLISTNHKGVEAIMAHKTLSFEDVKCSHGIVTGEHILGKINNTTMSYKWRPNKFICFYCKKELTQVYHECTAFVCNKCLDCKSLSAALAKHTQTTSLS